MVVEMMGLGSSSVRALLWMGRRLSPVLEVPSVLAEVARMVVAMMALAPVAERDWKRTPTAAERRRSTPEQGHDRAPWYHRRRIPVQ